MGEAERGKKGEIPEKTLKTKGNKIVLHYSGLTAQYSKLFCVEARKALCMGILMFIQRFLERLNHSG